MSVTLSPLSRAQPQAVEALLDDAFGRDRRARTAYRLREGLEPVPDLSSAAFASGVLIGVLQSWPVALDDAPLVLVGPVAVAPRRQGLGIGTMLMNRLIEAAPGQPMAMVGDPEYYGRWGFTAEHTGGWTLPGPWEPRRLLARRGDDLPKRGQLAAHPLALSEARG